jgi:hypothetical protein
VRSILPRFGRRIGTDPIPARSCIGADHQRSTWAASRDSDKL